MNTWLVTLVEGAAEILALADSLGVAHRDVLDFLAEGNLSSPVAHVKAGKMDAGDDSAEFSLQWAVKDIRLALDAAGRPLPLVELIRDRWATLADAGLGGLDVAAARHGLDQPAARPASGQNWAPTAAAARTAGCRSAAAGCAATPGGVAGGCTGHCPRAAGSRPGTRPCSVGSAGRRASAPLPLAAYRPGLCRRGPGCQPAGALRP